MSAPPPRPLPWIARLAPGVFYGWPVAVGTSLLSFVVVGIGFYALAVFLDALCAERGWSRAEVSFATTVYFVTSGIAGTLVGRSVDRRSPRASIAAGALVMALALLAIGRVESPLQLALVYPLLAVGFTMAGGVPTNAIITRWFVAKRALAMSVAHTGVSVGGIVLVPLATRAILEEGLVFTTTALAVGVVGVVWPVTAFVLRSDPMEHGLLPDGDAPPLHDAPRPDLDPVQHRVWTWGTAARTRAFWMLVAAFGAILFCQVATAMHMLSLLRVHLDAEVAAFAVSTTAAGSAVARLVVGSFADRVPKRHLGTALMLVQASAIATFALAESPVLLFGAALVFGFTIGNLFMLQTLFVGELFGMRSFGTVMGLLQLLTQTLSGLGPWVLGLLYDAFGRYPPGLALLAGLALSAAAIMSRVRPPPESAR